jgi:hypothetical protein
VQGEFVRAASPHGDGGGTPPSQYWGVWGHPPDPGSHEAIDPKFGIAADSYAEGQVSKEEIQQFLQSWFAHLAHGDTWRIRQQILADLYWQGLDFDV